MVQPGRPQMTIRHMRIAFFKTTSTNTYSEDVLLITLPLPKWLQESPSKLRYTYIVCLFVCISVSKFPTFLI